VAHKANGLPDLRSPWAPVPGLWPRYRRSAGAQAV